MILFRADAPVIFKTRTVICGRLRGIHNGQSRSNVLVRRISGRMKNIKPKMKTTVSKLIAMFATVAASVAAPTIVHAGQEKPAMQTATPKPTKSGHAAVNGVNYFYAVYGTGEPLLVNPLKCWR